MEAYVYYTIIFFSIIIISLYIYIIFEKTIEKNRARRKNNYSKDISSFFDSLLLNIEKGYTRGELINLKQIIANNLKLEIAEEKIKGFIEESESDKRENLIQLCENSGIIDYEITNLKSRNYLKATLACKTLGDLRSKKALVEIERLADSDNMDIKYNALMALAKIGDSSSFIRVFERINTGNVLSERSLTEIVDTFEGDKLLIYEKMINSKDSYISSIFIKSAGNYMDKSLIEKIAVFLNDEDKSRRIASIKAIGQLGDKRYLEDIAKALNDSDWEIRAVAARSLGGLSDNRALEYLVKSLCDKEWWVSYNSAYSIVGLPGGFEVIKSVFEGSDKFAKEILLSAIENSGILKKNFNSSRVMNSEGNAIPNIIKEFNIGKQGAIYI
jgi:HEAT repeat protein